MNAVTSAPPQDAPAASSPRRRSRGGTVVRPGRRPATGPSTVSDFVHAVSTGSAGRLLDALDHEELRRLVVELAEQLAMTTSRGLEFPDQQTGLCAEAARLSAQAFGLPVEVLTERGRRRPVADARAVAQSALRSCGLSLPAIGSYFGQHHATVLHSIDKVASQPRLHHVAARITEHLRGHYGSDAA